MYSKLCIKLILIFIINIAGPAFAMDQEIRESYKCIALFPIFEKQHFIPQDTLHSIGLKESGKKHSIHNISIPWPWTVNVEGKGHYFNNKNEAIYFVKSQIKLGKENIDVGCMQINLKHHVNAFDNLEEAFDPFMNINYAATFLKNKYDILHNWHEAIAHYHSATFKHGDKYKQDVIKIANKIDNYKDSFNKHLYSPPMDVNDYVKIIPKKTRATNNLCYINNPNNSSKRANDRLKSDLMIPIYPRNK